MHLLFNLKILLVKVSEAHGFRPMDKNVLIITLILIENYVSILTGLSCPSSKIIYVKIDENLEKWYKILDIALVKIFPISVVALKSTACFIMYFANNLDCNALELPIPGIW